MSFLEGVTDAVCSRVGLSEPAPDIQRITSDPGHPTQVGELAVARHTRKEGEDPTARKVFQSVLGEGLVGGGHGIAVEVRAEVRRTMHTVNINSSKMYRL